MWVIITQGHRESVTKGTSQKTRGQRKRQCDSRVCVQLSELGNNAALLCECCVSMETSAKLCKRHDTVFQHMLSLMDGVFLPAHALRDGVFQHMLPLLYLLRSTHSLLCFGHVCVFA